MVYTETQKNIFNELGIIYLKIAFSILSISLDFTAYSFVSVEYLEFANVLSVCNVNKLPWEC